MTAQSLVIESLLSDDSEIRHQELSLVDIYRNDVEFSDQDFLEKAESVINQLENGITEQLIYDIACLAACEVMAYDESGTEMVFLAIENTKEPSEQLAERIIAILKEIVNDIKSDAEYQKIKQVFQTHERVLDYLGQFFKNNFAEEIVTLIGVSRPTANKYIKGSRPNYSNYETLKKLAKIFYLQETKNNLSQEEIVKWYRESNIGEGKTIREAIASERRISGHS